MVSLPVTCSHCQSPEVVRNGCAPDGRQRYLCRQCGRRFRDSPRPNGYSDERRELILRACEERASLRGVGRIFGVSRTTLSGWLKKKP